jgi:hypothetical protein
MKRGTTLEFDSLELLLDTICNTFGGVLFMAILVIILVQRTGESIDRNSVAGTEAQVSSTLRSKLEQRKAELQSLQRAFQEYRTTLSGLATDKSAEQARQVLNLREEVGELTSRRVESVQRVVGLNEASTKLERQRQSTATDLELIRKEARSLTDTLERERTNRNRTVNLPMLRSTSKREFPLILRFGHLYFPFIAETGLAKRKSNLDDFVILDDQGPVIRVSPKPYAGLVVTDRDELLDALRRRINSLDKDSVYLAIGVWEDSFEQFQQLKEVVVKLGFEYRLVPIAGGEFIQESQVKETLVQ